MDNIWKKILLLMMIKSTELKIFKQTCSREIICLGSSSSLLMHVYYTVMNLMRLYECAGLSDWLS